LKKSLEEAAEIISEKHKITEYVLRKTVLKPDGTEYSESACRKTIETIKAK
jgi:preprotein translocase subunit Sss1